MLLRWVFVFALFLSTLAAEGVSFIQHPLFKQFQAAFDERKYLESLLLLSTLSEYENTDAYHYYLGRVYSARGELEEAEKAYQKALEINPEFIRAKLELALTAFLLKQYEKSRQLFEAVLETNPPAQVQGHINSFLNQIRKITSSHKIEAALIAGLRYDSNVFNTIESDSVYIPALNFSLPSDSVQKDDRAHFEALSLQYRYEPFNQKWGIKSNLFLYNQLWQRYFSQSLQFMGFEAGPQLRTKEWQLYVPFSFQKYWLGAANYLHSSRMGVSVQNSTFERTKLGVGAYYQKDNFLNPDYDGRDSNKYSVELSMKYQVSDSHLLSLFGAIAKKEKRSGTRTDIDAEILDTYGEWMWMASKDVITKMKYAYVQSAYKQDNLYFLNKRKDIAKTYQTSLLYSLDKYSLLEGIYQNINNASNHTPYQYDKAVYTLQYIRRWE